MTHTPCTVRRFRVLAALALVASTLLTFASPVRAESRATLGAPCRTPGAVRDTLVCRTGRDGKPRWRRNTKTPVESREPVGVVVADGLPFSRHLEPGLTAREVAFRFAKDWTALMACLDWGPDNHNATGKNELGPVTSKCNKAVWGTPNAFIDWYDRGTLRNEDYFGPVATLWEKYTSYGALLRHTECPESRPTGVVCTGYPRGYSGWYEGRTFAHHVFYKVMRVSFGGETWYVERIGGPDTIDYVRRMLDPSDPQYSPRGAAQFDQIPVTASYWEYPGCRMLGRATWATSISTCEVYWAYRDLSTAP